MRAVAVEAFRTNASAQTPPHCFNDIVKGRIRSQDRVACETGYAGYRRTILPASEQGFHLCIVRREHGMAKVTSKLQVTVPKAIAEQYSIRPGDEIDWAPAGDVIV